jgi:predicted nucleic acid-binding protein
MAELAGPLPASGLLLLEFRQSVRFQVRLHRQDGTRGYSETEARGMLRDLQADIASGVLALTPVDWPDAHQIAERLSATYTERDGHRLADILHVATAIHLGSDRFLTFDANQRRLAESEGMRVAV